MSTHEAIDIKIVYIHAESYLSAFMKLLFIIFNLIDNFFLWFHHFEMMIFEEADVVFCSVAAF